ncbi:DNA methyltransferase [Duganella vulcania]|uniref:site-specific DNA-methyltransferase (adenine-specific) n=1 Tax=Duganella vulcania TaxID=2692166 RepID=A0A845GRL5_9BURK|nr:DNA methyltransferase [Duganella vulcania]MYM96944.1 N-6 DNA methylase [Duganella vulcania]
MTIKEIEEKIQELVAQFEPETFIYDLLDAYGKPKASITRLQIKGKGSYNLSDEDDAIIWKKQLYYKHTSNKNLKSLADDMSRSDIVDKHEPRFIVVTNNNEIVAIDTKTKNTLDKDISELHNQVDFFFPWTGKEKAQAYVENVADVKAAEKMAKLFDLLREDNEVEDAESAHALNIFLSRILFCFFSEDTGIFPKDLFTKSIEKHTQEDGSDLAQYLERLFDVLNTEKRKDTPDYLTAFDYVNGGLFADKFKVPTFTRKSRKMMIECGAGLNWSEINPDIFGSMIQAVVDPDERGNMGMHYTSVPNIMKVIEPLFLNDLYDELKKNEANLKKLESLLLRLETIKVFDPACGSGNFLIIAYRELRKLEMEIFKCIQTINPQQGLALSGIKLSQFYGIELDDFAHEIAILSLWLAEHQMNVAFKLRFGQANPSLPLNKGGNIACHSANGINWMRFCPIVEGEEVYILGNPPYLGARTQSEEQKEEMRKILVDVDGVNSLDYIAAWFYKGAEYVEKGGKGMGLVSTNSITQGEQVSLLWPHILEARGLNISFAHTSFKWTNNAKNRAAVICVIIGINKANNKKKRLYTDGFYKEVNNISPYLTDTKNIYIHKRTKAISAVPEMVYGNHSIEGGFLILSAEERKEILDNSPEAQRFIKNLTGGSEFLRGQERWCIWIEDDELKDAVRIPAFKKRIEQVRAFREGGGQTASSLAHRPHQFRYRHRAENSFLLVPCTSSERRDYLPIGFFNADFLTTHSAQIIYDAEPYIFGILSSRAHMLWVKAVSGQMKSDIRYSNLLCYNNFPIPKLSDKQKAAIEACAFDVLEKRELYPELRISDIYDPEKMPDDLLQSHKRLDRVVNECYLKSEFANDTEQLSYLFKLYEDMVGKSNA